MSKEAMKLALSTLEGWANYDDWVWPESALEQAKRNTVEAITALRQALKEKQEPVANEVQLNIIRYWPDDFAVRLEAVWKDLIGFIPNYKLYDLQKMLAEFGFTMVLYEGSRPQAHEWVGLNHFDRTLLRTTHAPLKPIYHDKNNSACAEVVSDWDVFFDAVEAKLKERNHG